MSLMEVINDFLMAIFFLSVGLEIKREILVGELSSLKKALLPIIGACGGMLVPVLIFWLVCPGDAAMQKGLAIPMATDIAFSLGVLSVFKTRVMSDLSKLADDLKKKAKKSLKLYSMKENELTENISYVQYDFYSLPKLQKLKTEIDTNIEIINTAIVYPTRKVDEDALSPAVAKTFRTLNSINDALNPRSEITLDEDTETIVRDYCGRNNISLIDDFMCLGDAHYRGNSLQGYTLAGEHEEKRKARALIKVVDQIREHNEYMQFLGQFQDLYFVPLIIKNEGEIFADDISVKISFSKECFFDVRQLKISGENIAEEVKDFLSVFLMKDDVEIEDMEYGTKMHPIYEPIQIPVGLGFSETRPGLGHCQKYFEADLENYYPYISNVKGENVVYKFYIENGLKQFTAQFLCAMLMFKKPPEIIEYTITSKSFGYEIKDVIQIKR